MGEIGGGSVVNDGGGMVELKWNDGGGMVELKWNDGGGMVKDVDLEVEKW